MIGPLLAEIFQEVSMRVDGAEVVRERLLDAAPDLLTGGRLHVLAVGKAAPAMLEGLRALVPDDRIAGALVVAPEPALVAGNAASLPSRIAGLAADHPLPTGRSVAAGDAALAFVRELRASDRLLVLLSGGGSALIARPAPGLRLADKREAAAAAARGGATIRELNAIRKHLSAIKGGQLGLATVAKTTVLALSDVTGDPLDALATIASGPFAPDPTTFGEAHDLLRRLAPEAPPAAAAHLARGAAGAVPETPKRGDPRLAHVRHEILAGPGRVLDECARAAARRGLTFEIAARDTEETVERLAALYSAVASDAIGAAPRGGPPTAARLVVGNGEPRIVVQGEGRGGRATHLALLVARALRGRPRVAFLAAGTDDRDGSGNAAGAWVDGTTWDRARDAGLDPAGALARFDSATPLEALGLTVRGPGRSNLLDVHLLALDRAP